MNDDLSLFMKDLIVLLQERYNQSLDSSEKESIPEQKDFQRGANFAYYDTLDMIQAQLGAFGYRVPRNIVPDFGKRAELDLEG